MTSSLKGDVGRATLGAAMVLVGARAGRKVLATQAKERLSSLFGTSPIGDEVVRLRDWLWVVTPIRRIDEKLHLARVDAKVGYDEIVLVVPVGSRIERLDIEPLGPIQKPRFP